MASPEEIFRLMLIRPPKPSDRKHTFSVSSGLKGDKFLEKLESAVKGGTLSTVLEQFRKGDESQPQLKLEEKFKTLRDNLGTTPASHSLERLERLVNDAFGAKPEALTKSADFRDDKLKVQRALCAQRLLSMAKGEPAGEKQKMTVEEPKKDAPADNSKEKKEETREKKEETWEKPEQKYVDLLRLFILVEKIALKSEDAARDAIILLPNVIYAVPPVGEKKETKKEESQDSEKVTALETKLKSVQAAIKWIDDNRAKIEAEIADSKATRDDSKKEPATPNSNNVEVAQKKQSVLDRIASVFGRRDLPDLSEQQGRQIPKPREYLTLKLETIDGEARRGFYASGLNTVPNDLAAAQSYLKTQENMVKKEIQEADLSKKFSKQLVELVGGRLVTRVQESPAGRPGPQGGENIGPTLRPVGVADLLSVRMTLLKYEEGEIAHIENVLKGETKERTHRRKQTTEEILFRETEETTETERDQQSTERFELQSEASKELEESSKKEAGITVTGSYGPSVSVTANAGFESEKSLSESQKTASTYAKEVTEGVKSRIVKRVREQETRRFVTEVEETNVHKLDGKADGTSGIYRWVDKLYQAQIANYGRRMMFEFTIPEPGAFALDTMTRAASIDSATSKVPEEFDVPVEAIGERGHFGERDYRDLILEYKASGITPPPLEWVQVSETYCTSAPDQIQFGKDWHLERWQTKIKIPQGYLPEYFYVCVSKVSEEIDKGGDVYGSVGPTHFECAFKDPEWGWQFLPNQTKKLSIPPLEWSQDEREWYSRSYEEGLPVSIVISHLHGVVVSLSILCRRTEKRLQEWQTEAHAHLLQGYLAMKEKVSESLGIQIRGRNPGENRIIERNELKKAAITLIRNQHPKFSAIEDSTEADKYPQLSLQNTDAVGKIVQFFEHGFEWENMMYAFYGYMWAARERWMDLQQIQDNDPLHAEFLRAGSCRVMVPVRPGYEEMILYYLENPTLPEEKRLWSGEGQPTIGSEAYFPVWQEIQQKQAEYVVKSDGTVSVEKDDPRRLKGKGTNFGPDDVDREIRIDGKTYRVAEVELGKRDSPTQSLILTSECCAKPGEEYHYVIGLKLVGEPWEVRIPTSLVILDRSGDLPDFTKDKKSSNISGKDK